MYEKGKNVKKNIRICFVTFSNNADHQNVVYSIFNALHMEHDIYTIGIVNPKSKMASYSERNFYVKCPERPGIGKGTFNLKVLWQIKSIIKREKIDVIYFESQHLWNAFVMFLCPGKTKIVAVHDVIPHDGNKMMLLSNFVTCHMATYIVLRNHKYKELLASKYKLDIKRIASFELCRNYPAKMDLTYSGIFLCFGRIRKYKGFDLFAKIIEKTPNIKYRIVGQADSESEYLVDLVRNFSNVSLLNKEVTDREMIEEFRKADWIVLPYSTATQSGVIVDAYSFARPVIAFDVGAINEQICDGETGILVEKDNIEAFAKAVQRANSISKDELKVFSQKAYEFGYEKYSAQSNAKKLYSFIQDNY